MVGSSQYTLVGQNPTGDVLENSTRNVLENSTRDVLEARQRCIYGSSLPELYVVSRERGFVVTHPPTPPCKTHLPLDCYCNAGVNSQC